jgi:hypothetical protein
MSNSATPAKRIACQSRDLCQRGGVPEAPDPRTRAVPDSEPFDEEGGDIVGREELQADRVKSEVTCSSFRLELSRRKESRNHPAELQSSVRLSHRVLLPWWIMTSTPAVSFTVRRPSPVSRGGSSGADSDGPSFKVPALPKHLRNGVSTPGSPLAQSGSAGSSPKRSYDSVDSSGEEDETQDELILGFDKFGVQRCVKLTRYPGFGPQLTEAFGRSLHEKPKPNGPLTIPALKNRDWRALAKKRKTAQMYVPESGRAAVTGADGTVGGLGTRDSINSGPQAIGLQFKQKKFASEVGEVEMQEVEVEVKPQVEESEDQRALRALLASATGDGDESLASRAVIPVTEDEAFRQDIDELPEPATLDDYTDMPVSEFGAAMLRGMGWTGDGKGKKNVQPWLPQSRPALLGIGAKEKEIFDDGSKKKFIGKPDKKYIPVLKMERPAGSSPSSRNRTPSPDRRSGSRHRTRSDSPGRKDGAPRNDDRRRDRDDGRKEDRDRDSDRRKDKDRGADRRSYRDDGRDRLKERDGDRRWDRDRDGYGRDRDSTKRNRSRDRGERRSDKRD